MIGEVSFFDGRGRSATVWAIQRTRLLRVSFEGFQAFAEERRVRARELLFALGSVIAWRLAGTVLCQTLPRTLPGCQVAGSEGVWALAHVRPYPHCPT